MKSLNRHKHCICTSNLHIKFNSKNQVIIVAKMYSAVCQNVRYAKYLIFAFIYAFNRPSSINIPIASELEMDFAAMALNVSIFYL